MNTVRRRPWVAAFVTLLLMSAAAFAVGATVERAQVQKESTTQGQHTESAATDGDGGEAAPEAPTETAGGATENEALFGVDPESTTTLVGALLASVLLAGAVWWRPVRPLLLLGAAFCLGAAVLDSREISHQMTENRTGIAALAALVLIVHFGASTAAVLAARDKVAASEPSLPSH